MRFTKNVSEPWFSLIALGAKTVEGRLRKGDFLEAKEGDVVVWSNEELGFTRTHKTTITSTKTYVSFEKYLQGEGLLKCLPAPGVTSVAKGVRVYRQFFDKKDESRLGVVAIRLKPA